jgi:hypothetical protein
MKQKIKKYWYIVKNARTILMIRKWDKRRRLAGMIMVANACDGLGYSHAALKRQVDYTEAKLQKWEAKIDEEEFERIVLYDEKIS